MDKSREELEKEYAEATAKLEQYQHRGQRYENRIRYYTQGERKKRNHRLITRGGAVESIAPEVRGMSERAFFLLMENYAHLLIHFAKCSFARSFARSVQAMPPYTRKTRRYWQLPRIV